MKTYGQYCPVAKAAEVLGDRWTMLIVRDLLLGPIGFNELARGLPGVSRSLLSGRLRNLQRLGLVEYAAEQGGYRMTGPGRHLGDVVQVLGDWATRWILDDPTPAELDPDLLVLWMSRQAVTEALPAHKVVVEFDLHGPRRGRLWLVLERGGASVCHADPGLDLAFYVYVTGQTAALYRAYVGGDLKKEITADQIRLSGTPALVRAFPTWFSRRSPSGIAGAVGARAA